MVNIEELEKKLLAEDSPAEEITACYDKLLGDLGIDIPIPDDDRGDGRIPGYHMYQVMYDDIRCEIYHDMKSMLKEAVEEGMTTGSLTEWAEVALSEFEVQLEAAGFKLQAGGKVMGSGTVGSYEAWEKEPVLHQDISDDLVEKTRAIMEKFLDDAGIDILYSLDTDPIQVRYVDKESKKRLRDQVHQIELSKDSILIPRELAREISNAMRVSDEEEDAYRFIFSKDAWADLDEDELVKAVRAAGGEEEFCRLTVENADEKWDAEASHWDNLLWGAQETIEKLTGKVD